MRLKSGSRCRFRKDRYGRRVAQGGPRSRTSGPDFNDAARDRRLLLRPAVPHPFGDDKVPAVTGLDGEPHRRFDFAFDRAAMCQSARFLRANLFPRRLKRAERGPTGPGGLLGRWQSGRMHCTRNEAGTIRSCNVSLQKVPFYWGLFVSRSGLIPLCGAFYRTSKRKMARSFAPGHPYRERERTSGSAHLIK